MLELSSNCVLQMNKIQIISCECVQCEEIPGVIARVGLRVICTCKMVGIPAEQQPGSE